MTAMEQDIDDRYAGIDLDSLLNRVDRRPRSYGRKACLYEAPEFTRRLNGEETVMEGQSLCLDCKVIGFPAPSLRWFKDDEEIVDHPRIRVESDGKGHYSLYIDKVNKGDEAAYRCRAENVEGSSSCYFFLSVRCKPKSKKKRDKSSSKKRSVSFPPMFSTIVEKVEEEDKLGKEQEIQPPSPLTQFYYALTLKGRQTWPSFLGDWAFRHVIVDDNDDDNYDEKHARGSLPNGHGPDDVPENLSGRALLRRNQRRLEARSAAKRRRMQEKEDEQGKREHQERCDTDEREKRIAGHGGEGKEMNDEHLRKKEEEEREHKQMEEKENEGRKREEARRQRRLRREQKAQEEHEAKVRQMEEEQKEKEKLRRKEEEERIEKERKEEEERKKEKKRMLEEQRKREAERKEEEQRREESQKKEELRRRDEEKRKEEEKKKEERRNNELRKIEEEKRAEERRKEEERQHLLKLEEKSRKKDEERRKEEKARENEMKLREEKKEKIQEEKKRRAAENKRKEEDVKMKEQEEKKRREEEKQRKVAQRHIESGNEETEPTKTKPVNQKNVLRKFAKFLDEKELKGQVQTASFGVHGRTGKNGSSDVSSAATKFKAKLSNKGEEIINEENTSLSKDGQHRLLELSRSSGINQELKDQKAGHIDIPLKHNLSNQKTISSDPGGSNRKENERKHARIEENGVESDMKGGKKENILKTIEAQDESKEDLQSGVALNTANKKENEKKEAKERPKDSNEKKQSDLCDKELRKEEALKEKIKARQREQEEIALKQQKQSEQEELRLKQQKQKEELMIKMKEEEKRLKEKQEREQKEARLRNFMKEKIRQEQLQRQYEEEKKKKKEREEESKRRKEEEEKRRKEEKARKAEEKRLEIARRAELEKDLFEVKIYKRDYSFADLRKSLESYGGGELLNPEEHKYWDDILEKHNYSISDLKSVFNLSSTTSNSQERQPRSRVRRNSIEGDSSLERVKRSGSLSDLREAYTKSLDRPKKKRSEKKEKQAEDEFMKRSSSISDLKQIFASSSSPVEQQTGATSENAASLKIPDMSKSITEASSSQASPKLKQKQKGSFSSHVELKKLAVNVAAKRASFHEMVTQVQQRNAQDISQIKERARKRASLHGSVHGYDSYGSREIPVYKRLSSWSDEMEGFKKQDRPTTLSRSSSRPMSPNDEKGDHDTGETATPSSRVRPFVYNSIRTIARKTGTGNGETKTTLNGKDDVFENEKSSSTPIFYLNDENESGKPENKKTKQESQISLSNSIETNKENVLVEPIRTQPAVNSDHQDVSNNNVGLANSSNVDENKLTNRICLHAPLRKKDDSKDSTENANSSVSPGIFLEYIENEEIPSYTFQREEREPTPFSTPNQDKKESKSPVYNTLKPITPPGNSTFERELTPFFDKAKRPQSCYLEDNSSSESSPDREVEVIDKKRSLFLTVPTKAAFTFEGPVRAPRDSTPTPFLGNESPLDPMLDNTAGLRPPRESTPFFPKEEDDWLYKGETEESLRGSTKATPGKDTTIGRNQSGINESKTKPNLPLTKESDAGDKRYIIHHNLDQIDPQRHSSSGIAVGKNDIGEGMKFGHSSQGKGKTPTFKSKISGNSEKASATAKSQRQASHFDQEGHNMSDNSNNHKEMRSRESRVSNLTRKFQQKPESEKSEKATSDMYKHTENDSFSPSIHTAGKGNLHVSISQPLNTVSGIEKGAIQMSPKLNKQPLPASVANTSESSAAARKAAAAQARKELYKQRKLQEDQTKNIANMSTVSSKEEPIQSQFLTSNSKSAEEHIGKDIVAPKPLFILQQTPEVTKLTQQSVIQSCQPSLMLGQNLLTSTPSHQTTPSDQAATIGNFRKLKPATMTHETPIKTISYSPVASNASISNTKTQQITSAAKSSELSKPVIPVTSSPTSTKTTIPATAVLKSRSPTPVSLAKSSNVTSSPSNLKRDKSFPSPKTPKESFSSKPQNRTDSSFTSKKTEVCKPTQLPLLSSQNANDNHSGGMRVDLENPKHKTSPTKLKMPFSSTVMKISNGSSEREKMASPIKSLEKKSVASSSTKATLATVQQKSSPNTLMDAQPSLKATKDSCGEYVGDKNESHKSSKASKSPQTNIPQTRFCGRSQLQQTPPKPANLSPINPILQSPLTGIQNRMPVCHQLKRTDINKPFTTTKSNPGIVYESREQNITHSTLWSKLLTAFMNSFINDAPQSKEGIRKPPKRRKVEKSKDPCTSKVKSKVSRRKSCNYDWTKDSPFGQYTLEGVFLVCIMTLTALSADVRIEVFICYVLAAYYTFFVLRVLKILD